jgi:hypothetical protein
VTRWYSALAPKHALIDAVKTAAAIRAVDVFALRRRNGATMIEAMNAP